MLTIKRHHQSFYRPVKIFLFLSMFLSLSWIGHGFTLQNNFQSDLSGSIDMTQRPGVTFADVNGDGYCDLLGATDDSNDANSNISYGKIYCFDIFNDTLMWQYEPSPKTTVYSTPAVGDLDGDGDMEIVFGVGDGIGGNSFPGRFYILDHNGNYVWSYNTLDFDVNGTRDGFFASPALGDLNRDGLRDVVIGSYDQRIYAFSYNSLSGTYYKMWSFHMGDTNSSSAALANIDNDPYLEVIVGIPVHWEDSAQNTDFPFDIRYDGGMILVLNHDGTMHEDFRAQAGNPEKPKTYVTQSHRSSPAIADLDGDGWFEIVHATSAYRDGFHGRCGPSSITPIPEPRIYAWTHDGSLFWQTPLLGALPSNACDSSVIHDSDCSPAVADMDGDGTIEVVATQRATTGGAKVFIINGENGQFQSSLVLTDHVGNDATVGIRSSPVIANVDADSMLEALVGFRNDLMLLSHSGYNGGTADNSLSYINFMGQFTYNTSAIWDCDNDGKLEIASGTKRGPNDGQFSVFEAELTSSRDTTIPPWPMFRQNQYHTGVIDNAAPAAIADLEAEIQKDNSVRLSWSAPGGNGNTGCAWEYDVRYSEGSSAFNWDTAIQVPGSSLPLPSASGSFQQIFINGLANSPSYTFAIRTSDENGNWSEISNKAVIDFTVPTFNWNGLIIVFIAFSLVIVLRKKRKTRTSH